MESEGSVLRVLDANLNRAREGFRVLEDTARFLWEDESLYKRFRTMRHALDKIARPLYPQLVGARMVGDPGGALKEGKRKNKNSIVRANLRRCEESLRVLEEYGKLQSRILGEQFKKIRFALYLIEKEIVSQNE